MSKATRNIFVIDLNNNNTMVKWLHNNKYTIQLFQSYVAQKYREKERVLVFYVLCNFYHLCPCFAFGSSCPLLFIWDFVETCDSLTCSFKNVFNDANLFNWAIRRAFLCSVLTIISTCSGCIRVLFNPLIPQQFNLSKLLLSQPNSQI